LLVNIGQHRTAWIPGRDRDGKSETNHEAFRRSVAEGFFVGGKDEDSEIGERDAATCRSL